jgi:hypothetical protein
VGLHLVESLIRYLTKFKHRSMNQNILRALSSIT